jgi:O-antigen/teichoic acid export membrane protein
MKDLGRSAGVAVLARGFELVAGRGLAAVRLLVLAHLLVPEDFGLFSIAQVVVGTLLTLTDFGLLPALVQHRDPGPGQRDAVFTLRLLRGAAMTLGVVLLAPLAGVLFAEPRAVPLLRLLALRFFLEGLTSVGLAELERELRFVALATVRLPGAVVETVAAIVLAPRLGVWALPAGFLLGGATSVLLSHLLAPHRPRFSLDLGDLAPLLRFGRWIFLTHVVAVVGQWLLQAVITRTLGPAALGMYYLAAKLALLPAEVASEVLGKVAFPIYARLGDDLAAAALAFRRLLAAAAALLLPIYGLLLVLAPALVEHFLDERWRGTAPVVRVLALMGILGLFGDVAVPLLRGLGEPARAAALEGVKTVGMLLLVVPLARRFGLPGAASAWLPAVAVCGLLALYHVTKVLERSPASLLGPALALAAAAAVGGGVAAQVGTGGAGEVALAAAVGLGVFALGALGLDHLLGLGLRREIRDLLRARK